MKYPVHYRYLLKLRNLLLASGINGISQHDLNQKTRTKVFSSEHMIHALEEWKKRDWVQSFRVVGFSKHPKTMWRATDKLRDEWSNLEIDGDLPTAKTGSVLSASPE